MKNIGIYGATGSWDFGDYCMVLNNIIQMSEYNKNARFTIITPNIPVTRQYIQNNIADQDLCKKISYVPDALFSESHIQHYMFRIIRKFLKIDLFYNRSFKIWKETQEGNINIIKTNVVSEIRRLDVLVFNGGGYFQNSWGSRNLDFCSVINIASCLKIPVYFMGNSFGPLDDIYKNYVISSLINTRKIMIRDGIERSYRFLSDNGIDKNKLIVNTDDLIFYTTDYLKHSKTTNEVEKNPFVIIEIMAWITRATKGIDSVLNEIEKFVLYSIDKGFYVFLICFDKKDKVAWKCINQIVEELNNQFVHVVSSVDKILDVYQIYRDATFSVSMKYHPMILSIANEVPCVGIVCDDDGYYESKMYGAYESNGVIGDSDLVRKLDNVTSEWLIESFEKKDSFKIDSHRKEYMHLERLEYLKEIVADRNSPSFQENCDLYAARI